MLLIQIMENNRAFPGPSGKEVFCLFLERAFHKLSLDVDVVSEVIEGLTRNMKESYL